MKVMWKKKEKWINWMRDFENGVQKIKKCKNVNNFLLNILFYIKNNYLPETNDRIRYIFLNIFLYAKFQRFYEITYLNE